MIYKKLKSKELMLIKPEPIYYIMSCMDSKGGNVNLGEFNKLVKSQYYLLITQKHSPCILNTIKVYNKFVVGGFFNNVSPAEHHVNETNEPQNQPTNNLQPQYTPINYQKHELTGIPQNTDDKVEILVENKEKENIHEKLENLEENNAENMEKEDKIDDVEEDEDMASEDENKRSLVEESNLLSKWKRKKL
uniref:Uncharacterized protein n=1 Tax=Theileria annulata TaxID=5874 RepID=A0A3B0N6T1_THEAN